MKTMVAVLTLEVNLLFYKLFKKCFSFNSSVRWWVVDVKGGDYSDGTVVGDLARRMGGR